MPDHAISARAHDFRILTIQHRSWLIGNNGAVSLIIPDRVLRAAVRGGPDSRALSVVDHFLSDPDGIAAVPAIVWTDGLSDARQDNVTLTVVVCSWVAVESFYGRSVGGKRCRPFRGGRVVWR
jgi:hypothetical protein